MVCLVRLIQKGDIAQVTEIDREAFPTVWPPADYSRELRNKMAHYIVICDEERAVEKPELEMANKKGPVGLVSRLRLLFSGGYLPSYEIPLSGNQYLAGFAGFWLMAREAHIINIAVRQSYRHRGIGELSLILLIGLAVEQRADLLSLEVRSSNTVAQHLYLKYGFVAQKIRRGYYLDNREDAVVMTLDDVTSVHFQTRLEELREAHSRKWGFTSYQIVR